MANSIQRVAGYVLRTITVKVRQGCLIGVQRWIWGYLDRKLVADTSQFCVLRP